MTTGLFPLLGHGSMPLIGPRQHVKERLARRLLERHRPPGDSCSGSLAITVTADTNGRPLLIGPAAGDCRISFSRCDRWLWAALAVGTPVGIDVESPVSFMPPYPYERVFSEREWHLIASFDETRPQVFAAALWTCKEAAVKARGTGFSDVSPLEVRIDSVTATGTCGYLVKVRAEETYSAIVQLQHMLWMAIACPEKQER